jgi:hypothetical protein
MTDVDTKYDAQNHHQKADKYATNEQNFYSSTLVVLRLSPHVVDTDSQV